MRSVLFTPIAWEDFQYWLETDQAVLNKVRALIKDIQRNPFTGIGKPEPLKANLKGYWSRRITGEHRLVYEVRGEHVNIMACRHHYK